MSRISLKSAERFSNSPLWNSAIWGGTTYRCHPTGQAPPVMGLFFGAFESGKELFESWTNDWGNHDKDDAIRIAIIEGEIPGQVDGYSIRISANSPDAGEGQVKRMHPSPETSAMFEQFKAQYLQHGEFLLCPVIQKEDGQLWFDANSGIIKHKIEFLNAQDIDENDPDAVVLKPSEEEAALSEILDFLNQPQEEESDS